MKILYRISAYLLVLTGITHIAFSPLFFGQFGMDVLWFAGTGLSLVFLGNLNIIVLAARKVAFYTVAITSNILGLLLLGVIVSILSSVQSYIATGIAVLVLAGSISQYIQLIKELANKNYTVRF